MEDSNPYPDLINIYMHFQNFVKYYPFVPIKGHNFDTNF